MTKKQQTVTIRRGRDGSVTFKSTGGFDLRRLFPGDFPPPEPKAEDAHPGKDAPAPPETSAGER